MTAENWIAISGMVIALVGAAIAASMRFGKIETQIDNLKEKLKEIPDCEKEIAVIKERMDVVWEFLMRRALAEAVKSGIATINSPVKIDHAACQWFENMEADLGKLYQQFTGLSDAGMMLEIERHFGERIVKEVCVPHGVFAGACLLIALQVAKHGIVTMEPAQSTDTTKKV